MSRPEIIFVLGLQKTGLGSLAMMFEKFGYYRTRSRRASRVRNQTLKEVIGGQQPDLNAYFSDDTLFIDWPAPLLYKEAYRRFGDRARFILSMRSSPDKWVESLKTHSLTFQPGQNKHQIIYGFKYPHGHEQEHINYYEQHKEDVRKFFATQGVDHLFCEVCIEDTSSVKDMMRFLGFENVEFNHEHTNTGKHRLEKFFIRKKYNNFVIKINRLFAKV
jgi:hypothetical protein